LALRELGVRNVPLNFLNPIPGTPLENRERLRPEEALRIIALYRFLLPRATIRVCGGRLPTLGDRQREMFKAGANALMTGNYLTTPGVDPEEDRRMVEELGLRLEVNPCGSA
jgi:biotin synthase